MTEESDGLKIVSLDPPGDEKDRMLRDVRTGLSSAPKDLSPWPKYLYDETGSRLFEEITDLPEYYQTRTELSILRARAKEIVFRTGCRELVELGSGSARKTRTLLDAMFEARRAGSSNGRPVRYAPLDVSESALRESGERLLGEYPGLEIRGFIGDFDHSFGPLLKGLNEETGETGCRLVIFLGGTIGNFTPQKRKKFLSKVRDGLRPGDHLLVGLDLVKDARTLEAAYNDSAGVTARFNKNLLNVLNERLGGEFDPELFRHQAVYDEEEARIEMWLLSEAEHEVRVADLGTSVRFELGEGVRTEISAKFTPNSIGRTFDEAGLTLLELYTDDQNLFGLALGKVGA